MFMAMESIVVMCVFYFEEKVEQ